MQPLPGYTMVFTNNLAISHISIGPTGSEVVMMGLYTDTLSQQLNDLVLLLSLRMFNDLLYAAGNVDDELLIEVTDVLANETAPVTIDVSARGGLLITNLWFCLEPANPHEDTMGLPAEQQFYLRGFVEQEGMLPVPDAIHRQAYLLSLLAVQYRFYQYFTARRYPPEIAAWYAGLQQPVVMELAKTGEVDHG